jgi:TPR repeat protein
LCFTFAGSACVSTSQEEKDEQARSRWQDAANAGDPEAQYRLGRAYCCGIGPKYSTSKAIKWYCKSAKRGYLPAQLALADLYSDYGATPTGYLGKPAADFVNAYLWYTVAASKGDQHAFERRHDLGNMMDPADISAAKQLATRWRQVDCDGK